MQEVARFGRVGEFEDHCFRVNAGPGDGSGFTIEPIELRRMSEPGSVILSRVPGIGATVAIADLRHALDLVEQQGA